MKYLETRIKEMSERLDHTCDKVEAIQRELDKYKEHFGFCKDCQDPFTQLELDQYGLCVACRHEMDDRHGDMEEDWRGEEVEELVEDLPF